jgi:cell division septal protein FtsQ
MKKYKKSFKIKKKRRLFTVKRVLVILLFLGSSSGLIYLFFLSSVFKVKNIEVFGVERIPEKEIEGIVSSKTASNIFLANLANTKNYLIQTYPEIARVDIKRILPKTISVNIEERKPAAVLNNTYTLDKEGVAFEKSPNDSLPQITDKSVGDIMLGDKAVSIMDIILNITKKIDTKEVVLVSDKRLDIKTTDGISVYFSLEKDIDWQIEQLQVLLQEEISSAQRKNIEHIDLRYDKIFVK